MPLRLNHRSNWHNQLARQQLPRTAAFTDGRVYWWPPKWRHLCFQSLSMKFWGDRVLVRWNQMFVCSWSVLERFNFFLGGWWSGMVNHMGSLLSNFSGSPGFFPRYPQVIHHPKTTAELRSFLAMCCTEKSAWLVAGGTEGLTLTLAWQEIISPKRLMDDTTHPCFCSRCMVWSLVVEWYIIIFSDVNIRESKPNSGEKAVRSPSRSRQGCGMMVWQVVDGMVTLDGNAMGGCIEWSHNNKWLIPDVTKNVSWRNNFDVIWKDWGLEERTTSQSCLLCFNFGVVCFVCLSSFVFLSLRQKIPAKICQARRCPPLWIWQPLLWVLAFSRYLMFLGGIWNWVTELAPARNPQEI